MTEILDERAVSEIEAKTLTGHYPDLDQVRALCATVKHLRAKLIICAGDRLAANPTKWGHEYQIRDLQSQLEQLRAENQLLKIATADPADKEYSATVYDSKGNYTVLAQNAIDRNVSEFRTRAIQLCKDKAAEHRRIADIRTENLNDTGAMIEQVRADTANEICSELEKL